MQLEFPTSGNPSAPRRARRAPVPHPFLKWAGGKGQLLPALIERIERAGGFERYHEPFMGGAALFFELSRRGALHKQAYLSDNNPRLIEAYLGVRDHVEEVIALLHEHKARHSKDYYYRVRAAIPDTLPARAARIIYLNKTCFNGLYRENSKGEFNVPIGHYKHPIICDEENLRGVSELLKLVRIETRSFESVLDTARPGDLVYFDPPYHPLSPTSSFTGYAKEGFGEAGQHKLAAVFAELAGRGVKVMLSNSMTPLIAELYRGFPIRAVQATRAVNSKANRRGKIDEALVTSF